MSSILASLDMSLDDLIKKKKQSNPDARPKKGKKDTDSAGPVRGRQRNRRRNNPYGRPRDNDDDAMDVEDDDAPAARPAGKKRAVVMKKQQGKGGKKGVASILSRLGGKDNANQGTKILVKNLKFDILEDDVRELFGTVGEVKKAEIVYDRSGRSKGIARVWFARRSDAEKAIKQYDGRTLDGQPMQITLDGDSNVRQGLFGTALANREGDGVKFKVSLGGGNDQDKTRGKNARGRGRNQRRGNGPAKSAEDLDNEMDTYMKDA